MLELSEVPPVDGAIIKFAAGKLKIKTGGD